MSELKIYNSYTAKKEVFESIHPDIVGMYVCGPTVSGESHLGHARPYVSFDVIYRYLRHLGYRVRYVRNITDAGHFEEEGREARDKVAERAQLEKMEPMEIVQKYSNLFHWAMQRFGNIEPSIEPRATGHILEQQEMIKDIMEKGYAYESNGSVYFDLKKYAAEYPYGKLSGRKIDELLENTRELDGQEEKRNAVDFALWKKADPAHIQRWPSPWGEGYPGWHIECSAMSAKYLGEKFDIHGGGMDLKFPHHESEIAQSEIANGCMMANYWIHNNMITIEGKKMGKSYNNVIRMTELFSGDHPVLEQGYHPMVVRFYILQTHYRSTLDFSNEALQAAEKGLKRLMNSLGVIQKMKVEKDLALDSKLVSEIEQLMQEAEDAMNDDFNTAIVLSKLFEVANIFNAINDGHRSTEDIDVATWQKTKLFFETWIEEIFGLQTVSAEDNAYLESVMDLVLALRSQARESKDWTTSDLIRDKLKAAGINVLDSKEGSSYEIE